MDFENLATYIRYFYYDHPVVAIALGVSVVILFFFRPKAMLRVVGFLLIFAVAAYLFSLAIDMAGTGRTQKKEMIRTVD
jgi:hypothetical protein